MNCKDCNKEANKYGTDRKDNQRYRCVSCDKTFTAPKEKMLGNMYLDTDKAVMCLSMLVEGSSIRSIERVTGVNRNTILRLLETTGQKCLWIQQELVKNVAVKFVEADKIWAWVGMKDKTKAEKGIEIPHLGSAWTFTAIDAETKLITAWHLGQRNEKDATIFMNKLRQAIVPDAEFQLSTDSLAAYKRAVKGTLGTQAHYGQIHKMFHNPSPIEKAVRYSSGECIGCKKFSVHGNPTKKNISTSIVERNNLTMRMSMRRMTRLTNAFSKKWDNLLYSIALHFAHYNFCRPHGSLQGMTPAQAAGLTDTKWSLIDLLRETTHI